MDNEFIAGTRYEDAQGAAVVDWDSDNNLHKYLRNQNIDTDKYNLIGASIYIEEIDFHMSVYIQEKGAKKNSDGKLPIQKVYIETTLDEFIRMARSLNVMLFYKGIKMDDYYFDKTVEINDLKNK